jgi:metal-responsive CopG/Arc/MetJ family transcriptional regulator
MQRVIITIPPALLTQVEDAAAKLHFSRSRLIREALTQYVEAQRQQELRDLLKEGYLLRAEESRELAQEFFAADKEAWDRYAPWEV